MCCSLFIVVKDVFLATKDVFVMTKPKSCKDESYWFVATNMLFVATKTLAMKKLQFVVMNK